MIFRVVKQDGILKGIIEERLERVSEKKVELEIGNIAFLGAKKEICSKLSGSSLKWPRNRKSINWSMTDKKKM
jgi:hypothetical protein